MGAQETCEDRADVPPPLMGLLPAEVDAFAHVVTSVASHVTTEDFAATEAFTSFLSSLTHSSHGDLPDTGDSGVVATLAAHAESAVEPSKIWTFAYGANMGKAKLDALNIHPTATMHALLPGHALVFDSELGSGGHFGKEGHFPSAEKAFANVWPSDGTPESGELTPARGVVHQVTEAELQKLDHSEAPIMHRQLMPVMAERAGSTLKVPAWTYVSKDYPAHRMPQPGDAREGPPSERYARLVLCGAEEQALPDSYAERLQKHLEQLGIPADRLECHHPLQPLAAEKAWSSSVSKFL